MPIDRLARTLENSQGMVHGRKGKAVSLKSAEQRIDTGSMHAAVLKQAFASRGIGVAMSTSISPEARHTPRPWKLLFTSASSGKIRRRIRTLASSYYQSPV